ncbi:MAG: long-chain fatty acid--CoA ligase [Litorilinea sp.]
MTTATGPTTTNPPASARASASAAASVPASATNKPWVALYEKGVPAHIDIPAIRVPQILRDAAATYPDHVAIRMVLRYLPLGFKVGATLTYRQLEAQSNRFAHGLLRQGVQPGDRVALMLPNIPQFVVAFYGIIKAGAIVVNVNPTYTPRELQIQLADSGATTIVLLSGIYSGLASIQAQTAVRNVIITDLTDTLSWLFRRSASAQVRARGLMADVPAGPDIFRFHQLLQGAPATPLPASLSPAQGELDDPVVFQYTGGTTGTPKAAMLTHRNLVSNAWQVRAWFQNITPGAERVLASLPFFHVYGMTACMLYTLSIGGELCLMPDPRDTEHVMRVVQAQKVTLFPGVPAMYNAVVNHPKLGDYDLSSVRACLSGGAALPVEVANRFEALTGGKLVEGYGLTECSPIAMGNPLNGVRRLGAVGFPFPNTMVRIVSLSPDAQGQFAPLPTGEEGEIVVYGPQVMKGYWQRPEETAQTLDAEGGLRTGDIGRMDEAGYFYIVDRKKDLIVASGYKIVPREVEEVLFMHPDVIDAAVVGVPDARRGEAVKAFVVVRPDATASAEELRAFCKENLAPYKVPEINFRTELPKTQVGKVLRRVLVEEEIARQHAAAAASNTDV